MHENFLLCMLRGVDWAMGWQHEHGRHCILFTLCRCFWVLKLHYNYQNHPRMNMLLGPRSKCSRRAFLIGSKTMLLADRVPAYKLDQPLWMDSQNVCGTLTVSILPLKVEHATYHHSFDTFRVTTSLKRADTRDDHAHKKQHPASIVLKKAWETKKFFRGLKVSFWQLWCYMYMDSSNLASCWFTTNWEISFNLNSQSEREKIWQFGGRGLNRQIKFHQYLAPGDFYRLGWAHRGFKFR